MTAPDAAACVERVATRTLPSYSRDTMRLRRRNDDEAEAISDGSDSETLPCNRCGQPLTFLADRDFHEGTRAWGFLLGNVGELLTGGTKLEMWGCSSCGHVEFFLPGIG